MSIDNISVCICTYQRPELLSNALDKVIEQITDGRFSFDVVVIDNDARRSAEQTVRAFQQKSSIKITYDCESEKNIALARNRAIKNGSGKFVAFMDDDEHPTEKWLLSLYQTMCQYKAAGVLGPVVPFFPVGAPAWIQKTNIFDRRRMPTGTMLTSRDTRTGNVLLDRDSIEDEDQVFNPDFGLTGGEDVDFFERKIDSGLIYVWCDEGEVYETVPPERWRISFHLKKYLRIGTLNGERLRRSGVSGLIGMLKSTCAFPVRLFLAVVSVPFGKHIWVIQTMKLTYYIGCLAAYSGLSIMRYRN